MKKYFSNYLITQNESTGTILLFEIADNQKYLKRFRCDAPKNRHLKEDELLHLGKYIIKYVLPLGKLSTVFMESISKSDKHKQSYINKTKQERKPKTSKG
jgi:hypothetical protein